ncbi:glycosyltransferase 61 family protein [Alteromonas marina]|uniref:glycosyltransferase 61 family protein n=1 Tax=Alteromonas sp. OM2203 TaxID=3398817 RepID=UPI003AF36677
MEFENIVVMPIQQVLGSPFGNSEHKLGPVWPDWNEAGEIRFQRKGRPKDDKPWLGDRTQLTYALGDYVWCGPIVNHFGHQIADFSTRIACYRGSDAKYLFSVRKGSGFTFDDLPNFIKEIFHWFKIDKDNIFFVERPTVVQKLKVVPQQEQLPQHGPSQNYLSILDGLVRANKLDAIERKGTFYISRAGMLKGMIAGESYLESFLSSQGLTIIKPETLSLWEQLKIYMSAETLIFSEGSALHALQLLGHLDCKIRVLQRRPNFLMAKGLLTPRTTERGELSYHQVGKIVAGIRADGEPATDAGITIPRIPKLVEFFEFEKLDFSTFEEDKLRAAIEVDVKRFIDNEYENPRSAVSGHMDKLITQLNELGLI